MKKMLAALLVVVLLAGFPSCEGDDTYEILEKNNFGKYFDGYEQDWYGVTTDDERIAMADELISLFKALDHNMSDFTGNTLAQAMNDYYDQDKSMSIWQVACVVAGYDGAKCEKVWSENS